MAKNLTGIKPTLIIHGGAGNITPHNLPPEVWAPYAAQLLQVFRTASAALLDGEDASDSGNGGESKAVDAATEAVRLMEEYEGFNCGRGAVFTTAGTVELESSVMVSYPYPGHIKRSAAATLLKRIKHPILFARALLLHGDEDLANPSPIHHRNSGQGHSCLSGPYAEHLAHEWGLEMVDSEKYFWTRRRWEEHRRGLKKDNAATGGEVEKFAEPLVLLDEDEKAEREGLSEDRYPLHHERPNEPSWDGKTYLPQGTVGAVALDSTGALCVATSTGGLTNKLPGRVGDTPTVGAGFWAESWHKALPDDDHGGDGDYEEDVIPSFAELSFSNFTRTTATAVERLFTPLRPCLPFSASPVYSPFTTKKQHANDSLNNSKKPTTTTHSLALSGTGNGDSFLRLAAARTIASIVRFSSASTPPRTLASAITQIVGPGGELQQSAGDRWNRTGEGEGGVIGIELVRTSTTATTTTTTSSSSSSSSSSSRSDGSGPGSATANVQQQSSSAPPPSPSPFPIHLQQQSKVEEEEEKISIKTVFDFNCGGMMRCYLDALGKERVEVFHDM